MLCSVTRHRPTFSCLTKKCWLIGTVARWSRHAWMLPVKMKRYSSRWNSTIRRNFTAECRFDRFQCYARHFRSCCSSIILGQSQLDFNVTLSFFDSSLNLLAFGISLSLLAIAQLWMDVLLPPFHNMRHACICRFLIWLNKYVYFF